MTLPLIRAQAKQKVFELVEKPVNSVTEVAQALPILKGKVDCLFTANDVTVTKAFPALVAYAIENKIPLFAGDYSSVQRGAIGAIGQNYYNVGREAAKLIVAIADGTKVSQLPVRYTEGGDLYLNAAAADKMGVTLTDTLRKKAKVTYTKITEGEVK